MNTFFFKKSSIKRLLVDLCFSYLTVSKHDIDYYQKTPEVWLL